eukprot:5613549-Prymnesium_polylepis.1
MAICCERHWKFSQERNKQFASVTGEMDKGNLPRDPEKISPSLKGRRARAVAGAAHVRTCSPVPRMLPPSSGRHAPS